MSEQIVSMPFSEYVHQMTSFNGYRSAKLTTPIHSNLLADMLEAIEVCAAP
jgi:hypothetical protein